MIRNLVVWSAKGDSLYSLLFLIHSLNTNMSIETTLLPVELKDAVGTERIAQARSVL
jgi:hypothetical protein